MLGNINDYTVDGMSFDVSCHVAKLRKVNQKSRLFIEASMIKKQTVNMQNRMVTFFITKQIVLFDRIIIICMRVYGWGLVNMNTTWMSIVSVKK